MSDDQETPANAKLAASDGDKSHLSTVRRWWKTYCGPEAIDRGARARLRRCRSTTEAMQERAAIALAQWSDQIAPDASRPSARALRTIDLARVLAHVKTDDFGQPLMRAAGWKEFPGDRKETEVDPHLRPVLSEIRFRRLITSAGGEPLVRGFVRLVALLDHKVNVDALRRDFLDWGDPLRGEALRQRWAFDYYAASSAQPKSGTSRSTDEAS